jgi:predicted DNA binding CopG/RHH family protein
MTKVLGRPRKNNKQISMRLSRAAIERLSFLADRHGLTKSQYIEQLLCAKKVGTIRLNAGALPGDS